MDTVTTLAAALPAATPDPRSPPTSAGQWEERERRHDRQARAGRLSQDLGGRYHWTRCSLDTFAVYHAAQRPVLEALRGLSGRLGGLVEGGGGLVFYGSVGTGKDHLMAAMLYRAVAEGFECRWVNGQDVYGRFRDGMDGGKREEDILAELTRPRVLAISDPIPPAAAPSAYNLMQLYRLLDRRYRNGLSTWASLNAASPEDADQKLSAPVFDRLRDGAELLRCFWPSCRERARPAPPA